MGIKLKIQKEVIEDRSLQNLIVTNLVTIVIALIEGWSLSPILWVYWFQSVTIGIFSFVRIWELRDFSTEGFTLNNKKVAPTKETKRSTAIFFAFHYGFFHLGYFFFLVFGRGVDRNQFMFILLNALLFFGNHLKSYLYNCSKEQVKQNIGTLMFYPYLRIIPMHLTIILGSMASIAGVGLIFFMILKTISDAAMHTIEHRVLRRGKGFKLKEV